MKRLTYWCANNLGGGEWRVNINGREVHGPHVDRLAAYEDTGLEPEEIGELAVKMEAARPYKAFFEDLVDGQKLSEALSHIRYLAQADKEGRCVVLPCKIGDKMYDITLGELREKSVISLSMLLSKSVNHLVVHAENFRNAVTSYELQDIGKTVFTTRDEAEKALEGAGC